MNKDTFTLGGKEFSSRFILGSGKYSLDLIKAAVENAGAEIITLAVRRTNTKATEISWIIFRIMLRCFRIHPGQEMRKKQSALPEWQERSDAGILSRLRL